MLQSNYFKEGSQIFFNFKEINGFLELHLNTDHCSKGWSIRPHQKPTGVSI